MRTQANDCHVLKEQQQRGGEGAAWPHELNLGPCWSSVSRVSENGQTLHDAFDKQGKASSGWSQG